VSALKTRTSIRCRAHEALFVIVLFSGEPDAPCCAKRCVASGSTKAVFLYFEGFFSLLLSLILSPPSSRRVVFPPHHRRSLDFAVRRTFPSAAFAVVRSHISVIPGLHPAEIRSDPGRIGLDPSRQ
jgi:hypothetical protein